jgi:hypothetical protein
MGAVASYVVTRKQAGRPAVEQTLAGSNTGMYDSGLTPMTAYSWTIRAIQTDGSEGSTTVAYTTPAAPVAAPVAPALLTAKWTSFKPAIHGFKFENDFRNSFIGPPINWGTSGLCGGMSYAMLDYYNASLTVPNHDYRPANGTALQQYLYARQVSSLAPNMDKWIELTRNPLGVRSLEFFNWGLREQLVALRASIDRGVPVTLGLKGVDGWITHDHQVVAIGYDAGRYQGDLGANKTDLKIYVFDPNHPNETLTLVPNPAGNEYHYLEHPDEMWGTYFVDVKYFAMAPPAIVNTVYPFDGLVHELRFRFDTGVDDMRGGADHVDMTITLTDNSTQVYPNISRDGQWLSNYLEVAEVVLTRPVAKAAIRSIAISTNATGGLSGDNWDLTLVRVIEVGGGFPSLLATSAAPYRFTGAQVPLVIQVK